MSLCERLTAGSPRHQICEEVVRRNPEAANSLKTKKDLYGEAIRLAYAEFREQARALAADPAARLQLPFLELLRAHGGPVPPAIPYDFDPASTTDDELTSRLAAEVASAREKAIATGFAEGSPDYVHYVWQTLFDFLTLPSAQGGLGFTYREFELDPERDLMGLAHTPTWTNCNEFLSPVIALSLLADLPIEIVWVSERHVMPTYRVGDQRFALDLYEHRIREVTGGRLAGARFVVSSFYYNRAMSENCMGETPNILDQIACQEEDARKATDFAPEESLFRRLWTQLRRKARRIRRASQEADRTGRQIIIND